MSKLKSEIEECQKAMEKAKASENLKKAEKFNLERKIQELEKQIEKSEMHVRQAESKVERNQADINGVKEHIERYDIK